MRQLLPAGGPGGDADPGQLARLYAYPEAGRPWVRANMVASVDGAASVNGRSGGLSGRADREIFGLLRSLADVILVGAGTARAERYRPAQPASIRPELRTGRSATPPIAVISGRLDLDPQLELLTAAPADARTIVITCDRAPDKQRAAIAECADVLVAGGEHVDLKAALDALGARGHRRVLTEGGPHLLGQLAARWAARRALPHHQPAAGRSRPGPDRRRRDDSRRAPAHARAPAGGRGLPARPVYGRDGRTPLAPRQGP